MAKKTPRQRVVKRLDTIVSIIVRERDKKCVQCGSPENLTNGHVFSRRAYSTRWDVSDDGNCHTQCWGCNYKHGMDNYDYFTWYTKKFGQERFEQLRKEYKTIKKYNTYELEELYEHLTQQHKANNENQIHRLRKDSGQT